MAFMTVISVIAVFGLMWLQQTLKVRNKKYCEKSAKIEERKKKSKKVARKIVARPQKVVQNRVKAKTFYPTTHTRASKKAQNLEITTIGDSVI